MSSFKIFYSWQSDLPGNKTRYFLRDCIDKAVDLALSCEAIDAQRDEATLGTTGSPNIVTTLFSKIDECDLFIADISLSFENARAGKKAPNPNVMLELGYAAKTLGWEKIICICNTDYGENYPFDIDHQRITKYSLEGKSKAEVKAELSEIIFINIRDLRGSAPRARQGMATHIVGSYDAEKHVILNEIMPEQLYAKNCYRTHNTVLQQHAKNLVYEIQSIHVQASEDTPEAEVASVEAGVSSFGLRRIELENAVKTISESYKKERATVEISDKETIREDIESFLAITVDDTFFDLGNLKKESFLLSISGPVYVGTEEEKQKYSKIRELEYILLQLKVRKEYIKTFDSACFIPVAIQNISSIQDTNISIVLRVDIGNPINPSRDLILDEQKGLYDFLCRDDDDETDTGIISELFGLEEDGVIHIESDNAFYTPRLRTPIITSDGMAYAAKDEEDYESELKDVIAATGGNKYYDFEVSSLRPNEIRWLSRGMLIRPQEGKIQLSFSIHSDHSDGNLHGILAWES